MQNEVEHLKTMVREMKDAVDEQTAKKLNLDKCERLIDRLSSFSDSCMECKQKLLELKSHFSDLQERLDLLQTDTLKPHNKVINQIASHLQKRHKLVAEGTYLAIYMSFGLSMGVVFGLTIFDNIGFGMSIGLSIGLAIGAALDADAKKKGNTI
ncbi:hypothetical protein [Robertmurraya andreesenii]|uniref:RNase H-like nuclease (RuvC/YqgF family) n=1 Tax=Anoxybacillus andreesenii TaxID=1325932 RepID=A0ABT9V1B3_9BACL|nr:hypothetical protein [Robertmurraya andreesenii]MDQ0154696.1 putative RNase H-like nuclease (RuvC/YqgF family) [Robertmurraya andreesenii]